jgi:hypothetical protein
MDANTRFLTEDVIKPVFEIVQRAVQSPRPKKTVTRVEATAGRAAVALLCCSCVGFAALIALAIIFHFWPIRFIATVALLVAIATELAAVLSLLSIVVSQMPFMNRVRSNPVAPILELVQVDLGRLLPYTNELMTSPLPALAYVRHHIVYQRDGFDNRRARLIGQLDKVGTFPAIVTLGISVVKLVQDSHLIVQGSMVWTVAGSLAAFYLLSLLLADTSDKFTHIVAMLDFSIEHHPEAESKE